MLTAGECLFAFQHGELTDGSFVTDLRKRGVLRQLPSRRSLVGGILQAEMGHHVRQLVTGLAKAGKKAKRGRSGRKRRGRR